MLWQSFITFPKTTAGFRYHNLSISIVSVLPSLYSARASSASLSSISSEPAKTFSHLSSDLSSSITHFARAFCSISGSFDASLNALSKGFVIVFPFLYHSLHILANMDLIYKNFLPRLCYSSPTYNPPSVDIFMIFGYKNCCRLQYRTRKYMK
jgi:hypothetical protein